MNDALTIKAHSALELAKIGHSLARTIYTSCCDITVDGELGAGKTTFVQGFGRGMGIDTPILSPTFALEERYHTTRHGEMLHLDLYRLTGSQARDLLLQTEDHDGPRCIEWAARVPSLGSRPTITVSIAEQPDAVRAVAVAFRDAPIPSPADIAFWRDAFALPQHVQDHCHAVARVAVSLADALIERGTAVRKGLLEAAAQLHDLLRFLDFQGLSQFPKPSEREERTWADVRARFPSLRHEAACAAFLEQEGFTEAACIVRTHGLALPPDTHATVEQELLYYADKRCAGDRVVSLDERFADFERRYGNERKHEALQWMETCRAMERRLFGDNVPRL